ncbi:hypothetical protein H310_06010 [Aphanomyces invadans]|uniref:Mini-chromosome maintenance complex-binding protein n=1 Tax=Aphanomyces invadans TaxID=157072 RepID=A0A024U8C4_9STRA|nr:hypothetical protein H310_06010 [Aphanomyces invadans]ETW02514.1 hypothetical protein H310_06010 [Aphanomyces invadans]|eukprot:XP_008869119.1 hypothetical protein H310_06010 [Aphanomyces invadans]
MATRPVLLTQALLDAGKIPHGSQVRWLGLVRDVGQPQLMVDPADESAYIETTSHRCEVIPGHAAWLHEKHALVPSVPASTLSIERMAGTSVLGKKKRHDLDNDVQDDPRPRPAAVKDKTATTINFAKPTFQVMVRAYQGVQYKVNHLYEFVGELDLTPQALDDLEMEWQGEDATASKDNAKLLEFIPTLHVKDASERDYFGYAMSHCGLGESFPGDGKNNVRIEWCLQQWKALGYPFSVEEMRQSIVDYLATFLQGDVIAADFILLCLLSRVYQRSQATTPFGHFAVNLMFPNANSAAVASACAQLVKAIHGIVPIATTLNLTLESLNSASFFPRKDYTIDYLHSGLLQLPEGSAVVVDESNMITGQLSDRGTRNIQSLMSLVENQTLTYDFQFYHTEFQQDVKFITLSKSKSILPTAVHIRHEGKQGNTSSSIASEDLLQCFRLYIAVFRSLDVELGNDGAQTAEQWYVEERKVDKSIRADDLHRLVRVARLVALSFGTSVVTSDAWRHALELDKTCQQRGRS